MQKKLIRWISSGANIACVLSALETKGLAVLNLKDWQKVAGGRSTGTTTETASG